MTAFAKWLYLVALIVWVGAVAFFSFVAAPAIFGVLPKAEAARTVGVIFPAYYRLGYVCGAALVVTCLVLRGHAVARLWWSVSSLVAAAMLAATLYAGTVVLPAASALRPQVVQGTPPQAVREEFDRLHRLALSLNAIVLAGGTFMSVITAAALRP
jgi:uncharacterized membrane protein